ncbi:DENND5 [Lepeophtheirus salmonis]|uniref:DENND5 n=1 Tax=Lepeophtheirus salmonis TaxID=72036 RepID=A0A7R8HF21_LEPSM|nr:DENND5 [Lepeophtheirus salmonis]CAF3037502.1 DENND5 [Lepeophtheirus salmonis]
MNLSIGQQLVLFTKPLLHIQVKSKQNKILDEQIMDINSDFDMFKYWKCMIPKMHQNLKTNYEHKWVKVGVYSQKRRLSSLGVFLLREELIFIESFRGFLNPLERSYKPRILRHYPSEIESWSGLNLGALSNLTLPQGLKFCTERELLSYKPSFHPFVLTREDGSKLQGFSLAYYECVTDTSICQALQTLQHMHSTEMAGESSCSNSRRTAERPKSARVTSERSRSLPRHYNQRFRSSSTVDLSGAFYDSSKDNLYVTKSLAFISSQPLVSIAQQVLYSIYKYINTVDYDISVLEGFLYNLLFDIPLPSPGHAVRFWSLGEVITMSLPREPDELPLFDYNLFDFFDILGIENAIKLWICVLLEHQTVVFSSDFDKLMLVCESITSLCYPFKWPHVYVPILPPSLENFLDAPVPYIMGLLRRTHDYELYKRSGTVAILDIDSGELELPEELPQFPCESELLHEIKEIIVEYGGSEGIDLLKEHAKELAETVPNMESFNKKRDNENEMDESSRFSFPFLSSFMETQIFYNFIEEMSNNSKKSSFSSRMKKMKTKFTECIVRTLSYEKCECINESQKKLMSRLRKVELSVSPPKTFKPNVLNYRNFENSNKNFNNNYNNNSRLNNVVGVFPLFESDHFARNNGKSNHSAVIFRGISSQISTEISATGVQNVPEILNSSPAAIAEMNWSFVQQLLEECKQKTRRILLEKLGSEAVEWGHAGTLDNFHTEENMLAEEILLVAFFILMKSKPYVLPDHARPVQVISITSMDNNILAMMHNVSTIHEIKTEIGYARAWIRLTLEQKKLSQFLQILLSDHSLLQKLYKRYAFLRNEDEREQAIHYTQTLNTVDFSCFTNAYLKSSLLYQVLIFPSQKTQALSTANLWIHIVGSLGENQQNRCTSRSIFSCPISNYKSNDSDTEIVEIQTMLGDSINRIIKFYHKSLVQALICVFSFGYKSARLFGKNLSNHLEGYETNILDSPKVGGGGTPTGTLSRVNQFRRDNYGQRMYTKLITRIETTCTRLGKDDKFQLFVSIAAQQLYDEVSFLRDTSLTSFLSHILETLEEIRNWTTANPIAGFINIDGNWSPWSVISTECVDENGDKVTCGGGEFKKIRSCTNPVAQGSGEDCKGITTQSFPCNNQPCKMEWSEWSSCSTPCGRGVTERFTLCSYKQNVQKPLKSCKELNLNDYHFTHIKSCNTWNKTTCPSPCTGYQCMEFGACEDMSTDEDPLADCVCQLGRIMNEAKSKCIIPPPPVPTPRPIPTLAPAVKSATTVVTKTASTVLIMFVGITLILFASFRIFDHGRVIQMNMEIALICAHICLLLPVIPEYENVCKVISILIHFFHTACFMFIFLESLHMYSLVASVVKQNGMLSKCQNISLGWMISIGITLITISLEFDNYGGEYHCWLRMDTKLLFAQIAPIVVLMVITFTMIEAAGVADYGILKGSDYSQITSARISQRANLIVMPLVFASFMLGTLSEYEQNVPLYDSIARSLKWARLETGLNSSNRLEFPGQHRLNMQ